ncbi:hypothetical protein [Roseitranquillus sediminis]|uniref:hypothetical protein n=1 Tax=Roseitranquillus sediminis TaxID=2809051 RepID=UPI001D0C44F8|nr:hypothetical protein [Roseitranquillus sediminis]MBM9593213.1 hypothetical protein [Roseitranquillus sediminis]
MLSWLNEHSGALQVIMALVSALIWLVYLQIFLLSYVRQRRPEMLISMGAGIGLDARCFIANLGLEPIYISQLLMRVSTEDGEHEAATTDRQDMTEEQMKDPKNATNQGPLSSGKSFDAGSFRELTRQVLRANSLDEDTPMVRLELTVVAMNASSAMLFAARRRYDMIDVRGQQLLEPQTLSTEQIRSIFQRRRLRRQLRQNLAKRRG